MQTFFDVLTKIWTVTVFVYNAVYNAVQWVWVRVPNSIKGTINGAELVKILLMGAIAFFTSGGGVTGVLALINIFAGHINDIFPQAAATGCIISITTMVFDYLRRKFDHGVTAAQAAAHVEHAN